MFLSFEFQIPKNTPALTPKIERFDMGVNAAFIKGVEVVIPEGHKGLARMKISTSQQQIIPALGSGTTHIRGDKQTIRTSVNTRVPGVPYYLICEGYNEDLFLAHSFIINIEV